MGVVECGQRAPGAETRGEGVAACGIMVDRDTNVDIWNLFIPDDHESGWIEKIVVDILRFEAYSFSVVTRNGQ